MYNKLKTRNQISDDIVKQCTSDKQSDKHRPIDCSLVENHHLMISEGLRLPEEKGLTRMQDGKPYYFQKTELEKEQVKQIKKSLPKKKWIPFIRTDEIPMHIVNPAVKLIVHIKNKKKGNKFYNTLSFNTTKKDMRNIISFLSDAKINILKTIIRYK